MNQVATLHPSTASPGKAGHRRVLLVARTLGLGGMERMTVNLANAFSRQGHEVHLLVFKDRVVLRPDAGVHMHMVDLDRLFRLTVIGGIYDLISRSVSRYLLPKAKKVLYSFYFHRLFRLWLSRFERRYGRVDLIVARGYGSFEGLAGFKDKRLVRVVVNEQLETADDPWHRRFFRDSFHRAKVAFNSQRLEQKFQGLCAQMSIQPIARVISNPTDLTQIRESANAPAPIDGPYILNVGRFEKSKNQQLLLSAFALIHKEIPHRLVLVGKGALQASLQKKAEELGIRDRIVFAGQQQNPYPWFKHAALFVLSSLHEGLPNVVIESLVCGTPVVVTRGQGGTVELMRGELAEFIAEMDPRSLAQTMLRALVEPPEIDPAFLEDFSLDVVAQKFLALADTPLPETDTAPAQI